MKKKNQNKMFRLGSSFCLLITTVIVCILYATNGTFAQTISAYDLGVNASQVTHVRVKRATYNTFIISHTLDPGNKNFFCCLKLIDFIIRLNRKYGQLSIYHSESME